jgi:hypothetical protein
MALGSESHASAAPPHGGELALPREPPTDWLVLPTELSASTRVNRRLFSMRSAVIGLFVFLVLPASALAKLPTIAPPGNSGISQYQEDVPTAKGNQPTDTIVPGGGSHGGGSSGGTISPSTLRALDRQGSAGRRAAALAEATAPGSVRSAKSGGANTSGNSGSSPVTSVVKALTGSSSNGGLGPLLPIILALSLLGAAVLALLRRRAS